MQRFVYHSRLDTSDSPTQFKLTVIGDLAVPEKALISKCAGMQHIVVCASDLKRRCHAKACRVAILSA